MTYFWPLTLRIFVCFRIPALVDHSAGDLPIFESGAIMWWAASQDPEGKLFPKDAKKQADVMSWLMFQMVRSAAVNDTLRL